MVLSGVNVRVGYMVLSCFGLIIVTIMYAFLWLYVSTISITAPICQLPGERYLLRTALGRAWYCRRGPKLSCERKRIVISEWY